MWLLKVREMQHCKGRKENWVHGGGREDVRFYFRNDEEESGLEFTSTESSTCELS